MASSSSSSPEMSVPRSTNTTDTQLSTQAKLREVLEDLSSRFILNLPDEELASLERVCFQVEQAHWYYEDFVREQDSTLPTMTLKKFSNNLFHVCPLLSHWGDDHEQTFQSFLAYKTRVPVCGAIMLNETWDKCLLVKGWKSTSAWSFPKGKINEQEPRDRCAIREVLEETGYDLDGQINPTDVVELSIKDQSLSLYIVPNVPEDYHFETRTRKEISKISWFKLGDLPTWRRNKTVPGKFYLITPFIGPLKAFIRNRKPRDLPRRLYERQHRVVEPDPHISSEEDGHGYLESHDSVVMTQESSSQSSSADNGDPQTPSPLYSEPLVNHAADGVDPDAQHALNMDGVDPHFARLLSSLSLSASTTSSSETVGKPAPNGGLLGALQSMNTQPTPAVLEDVSLPKPSSPQPGSINPARSSHTPSVGLRGSPSSSAATLQRPTSRSGRVPSPPGPSSPSDSYSTKPNGNSTHPSHSPTSRRTTVTADLSPYMSRAAVTPAIPKQMKYITMLEHIAKESERMTPSLERQASATHAQWLQSQRQHPSASGPPVQPLFPLNGHPPPFASHGNASVMPNGQNPQVMQNPQGRAPLADDPFIVRPRTSAGVSHSNLHARPSMSEDQLRSMMAGGGPNQFASQMMGPYPPRNLPFGSTAGPPVGPQPRYFVPNLQVPPHGLRVIPPEQFYPQGQYIETAPLSASAASPSFNFGPPRSNPANAQLLSILNTPSVPRVMPGVAPGVLNGVGHR